MLTVAFAAFNGADTLPLMLEALTRIKAPEGAWRLIAVDNASTDETYELLLAYRDRLPLTVLQQPLQGKSRALNLALEHAKGDLLVLTDDDVLPHEDWPLAWRGCADGYREFGVFGGMIEIHWTEEPPSWIRDAIPLGIAYALTHGNLPPGKMDPRYIAGLNIAIRTDAICDGFRFDETLGPSGADYAMGEDTAFAYAAQARGCMAAHCPEAIVEHIVHPAQYEKSWLKDRAYRYGQARGLEDALSPRADRPASCMHMPRWMLREYLRQCSLDCLATP